ncbi:hypothetical protein Goshw_013400 [Gossypium schwendimanii]|uniref:Uncharacterized protein n=1 Tax=Gossypium schwendimanii TaxID=34291 RepID=A0A7J9LGM4_GOSSC|nr:hypothetical protein [Gossypium schwendimanii]
MAVFAPADPLILPLEEKLVNANSKALYVILYGFHPQEFKRITKYNVAKLSQGILKNTQEGIRNYWRILCKVMWPFQSSIRSNFFIYDGSIEAYHEDDDPLTYEEAMQDVNSKL